MIQRTPIPKREALFSKEASYSKCVLCCGNSVDCSGIVHSDKEVKVVHLNPDFSDWDNLEDLIWKAQDDGNLVRLVSEAVNPIPNQVIWALSYSDKNILQVNINLLRLEDSLNAIRKPVFLSVSCGLYVVATLYPIIPYVTMSSDIVRVIDLLRNVVHVHVNLKPSEITDVTVAEDFINFNGHPVPLSSLSKTKQGWIASKEYLDKLMNIVNSYAVPRKMSVSVCGKHNNCTGLEVT